MNQQQIDTHAPKVWNKRNPNCPKDAVYVGRPSKWGNPFKIGRDGEGQEVVDCYRRFYAALNDDARHILNLEELRGQDLVCWCAPLPCHADVLLELANKGQPDES